MKEYFKDENQKYAVVGGALYINPAYVLNTEKVKKALNDLENSKLVRDIRRRKRLGR